MRQYIAFLRGINVGGHRVKMVRLRELFEELGLSNVATFIASGNVIFWTDSEDVEALRDQIERHLHRGLGYEVATFLRSPEQLDEIASFQAPDLDEGVASDQSVYVILLLSPASDTMRSSFECLRTEMDEFLVSGTEIYWQIRGKVSESPLFGKGLDEALEGVPSTSRNMNTIRRLAAKSRQGREAD
jgi:uncharacterized protein (DUF1697 family)